VNKSLKEPVVLKPGQTVRFETKASQLASLKKAVADGKLAGDAATKAEERINKTPDFVAGELILVEKVD